MHTATARPLAVVTGASTGIGRALARQFAEHGFDLVVAADETEIHAAADELARYGARVEAAQVDLAVAAGVEELHRRIATLRRPVDALALNAAVAASGGFATGTTLADELRVVDLNVRSTVHLAKLELPAMVRRGAGRVLFTSSIAAAIPGTFLATYDASKAFVQSFALALREELRGTGVTVTALMPGPTQTPFFDRAGMRDTRIGAGRKDDAEDVARAGFAALMAGEERVVAASLATKLQARGSRLLPDSVKAKLNRLMAAPGSARR